MENPLHCFMWGGSNSWKLRPRSLSCGCDTHHDLKWLGRKGPVWLTCPNHDPYWRQQQAGTVGKRAASWQGPSGLFRYHIQTKSRSLGMAPETVGWALAIKKTLCRYDHVSVWSKQFLNRNSIFPRVSGWQQKLATTTSTIHNDFQGACCVTQDLKLNSTHFSQCSSLYFFFSCLSASYSWWFPLSKSHRQKMVE